MKQVTRFGLGLVLILCCITGFSQETVVRGLVRDAKSKESLQGVSVVFKGGKGVESKADGTYELTSSNMKNTVVEYSYVGYKTVVKNVFPGRAQEINIDLQIAESKNVTVTSRKRSKYTNKNNPAVELIRRVIDNKDKNRVTNAYNYVSYDQYEKMEVSMTKTPEKLLKNKLLRNWKFVFENNDSTKIEGKPLLPIYMNETFSRKYFRKEPEKSKTYIVGEKKVDFGEWLDVGGINSYLDRLYEEVNVYDNNISLLTNTFLSPIADMAPTFYKFYITDTTVIDNVKLVRLDFYPRNPEDLLFKGTLFVTLDGNYSVQKLVMSISKHANLNFVRELKVNQNFEKGPDGRYHVIMSNTIVEFAITKGSKTTLVGERLVSLQNYKINVPGPDSVYKGDALVRLNEKVPEVQESDTFWNQHRYPPLSEAEAKVYSNIDSLKRMKSFRTFMDIATLLFAGYKSFGAYEVGPLNAFYSFNPVEGFRMRIGGRTTPKFNPRIYLENYVAYGFKDQKWKYYASAAYSFNKQSVYAYPLNFLRASFQRDTKIPGQELSFVVEDNFLLSFKRGKNDRWLYNDIWKLEYVREFGKEYSYQFGFKNWKQTPAGVIEYVKKDGLGTQVIPNLTTSELQAGFTWSPHQQFYQGKRFRIPIINKYPIVKLRYAAGIKGLANGEYNYHNINLSLEKRTYLSQFGYVDLVLEGGYIFGQVPYPLMTIHRANQTYSYQIYSYNLMNFLEFVSDHFASINLDYKLNGFIFNRIPLFKKLKWREALSAKVLYGGVRNENNPYLNPNTLQFPVDKDNGLPTTYILGKEPYVEVSAGIMNILKMVRVDLVKRLTYLNHPDVTSWGIRSRVRFDF